MWPYAAAAAPPFRNPFSSPTWCRHVTLIHRRQEFRGDPILLEALQARSNVTILPDTRITALESRNGTLTGLLLEHAASGTQSHLDVDGLFVAVGQQPDTTLSQALGIAGEDGYIPAGEDCRLPSAAFLPPETAGHQGRPGS